LILCVSYAQNLALSLCFICLFPRPSNPSAPSPPAFLPHSVLTPLIIDIDGHSLRNPLPQAVCHGHAVLHRIYIPSLSGEGFV
ncbi:hypothetical protein F5148DRAFT_1192880, partial [Russula earlei]